MSSTIVHKSETTLFDKYEILSCLKKDAYSSVYLARHIHLHKKIILKTLNTKEITDQVVLARFKREAKILTGLDHPNIIKVLDCGIHGDFFFISFEYFASQTLQEMIRKGQLANVLFLKLLGQLASGLSYAHENHIIHRDLKPENILVNDDSILKIADFGLAFVLDENNLTNKSSIVGTPSYMSPEQIRGEKLTPQSDLFSIGIVVFEMLMHYNPFTGKNLNETLNNIQSKELDELLNKAEAIPDEFKPLLHQLLQRDRKNRITAAKDIFSFIPILENITVPPEHGAKSAEQTIPKFWLFVPMILLFTVIVLWLTKINLTEKPILSITPPLSVRYQTENPLLNVVAAIDKDSLLPFQSLPEQKDTFIERAIASKNQPESPNQNKIKTDTSLLPGILAIQCLPWADVYIDFQKVDTTPLNENLKLASGEYLLTLRHPDYPDFSQNIIIEPEIKKTVRVNLDTLMGYLDCQIYPWGDIWIDGKFVDQTPLRKPIVLKPGHYALAIQNPNFSNVQTEILITRNDTLRYALKLK